MDGQSEKIPSRERLSKPMKKVYDTFIECLDAASPEVAWATFFPVLREGFEHAQERGRLDERKTQQKSSTDSIENIKAAVREAVSEAFHAPPPTWASIEARNAPISNAQTPRSPQMAVPARVHREVIVKGSSISSAVIRRKPAEIVNAVNGAIQAPAAVAARRLPSGDTVVTFREPARPHIEADAWVKTAFGPEAALSRRLFTIIVKSFPVRLSDKQDTTKMVGCGRPPWPYPIEYWRWDTRGTTSRVARSSSDNEGEILL